MRVAALTGARGLLLAGPVVLAFFSGGFFDEPRVWAGAGAWLLVLIAAFIARRPLPRSAPSLLALGAFVMFAGWTLASFLWSPIAGTAYHDGQRVFLYAGTAIAAAALLRGAPRAVEPAVGGGVLIVMLYSLSERLLPGLVTFEHSINAAGRLEQPLTYWNAMGELAAVGFVLSVRLAGDPTRRAAMRMAGAAAGPIIGLALYLTYSRGALFACAAGLVALLVAASSWAQVRAAALAVGSAVLAGGAAAILSPVTNLEGSLHVRERDGATMLVALAVLALAAALIQRRMRAEGRIVLPRWTPIAASIVVVGGFGVFIALGANEKSRAPLSTTATRLTTLQSNRYAYWRVAIRAFDDQPVRGVGGGGWAVYWLRDRGFPEGAKDAHSLYIQTLAELGVIGAAMLAFLIGCIMWCAVRAHRRFPQVASGMLAGAVVLAVHAAVDWDWEMPAATLPALLLVGTLIALADEPPATDSADLLPAPA